MSTHTTDMRLALLRIEGPDALAFAQAQFTSDVSALQPQHWQWSAWLNARGQVLAVFHLLRTDDQTLLLALRGGDAQTVADRLRRYVLRAKVQLTPLAPARLAFGEPLDLFSTLGEGPENLCIGLGDGSLRLIADEASSDDTWRLHALSVGHPWLPSAFVESFLPPALGLRRLGAVHFRKGCFPGQEIAARLHYRGGHKYSLHHLALAAAATPGTRIELSGTDRDMAILDCVQNNESGYEALAILHTDLATALPVDGRPSSTQPICLQTFTD